MYDLDLGNNSISLCTRLNEKKKDNNNNRETDSLVKRKLTDARCKTR